MKIFLPIIISIAAHTSFAQSISKTGSRITTEEAIQALDFHNKVRKDVGVHPLEWSAELSRFAQEWADQLAASGCKMRHRPDAGKFAQKYGENIFWGAPAQEYSTLDACESWYSEIKFYKHEPLNQNNWKPAGHYTQLVWYNTTSVGMGKAICKNNGLIVVANYNPAGNYLGQKAYK